MKMMKMNWLSKCVLAVSVFALGVLASHDAKATQATANLSVTGTVIAGGCTSLSATALAFPAFQSAGPTSVTASSTVTFNCTVGIPWTLDGGNGLNSAPPWRQLNSGANLLKYQLYKDAAFTQIFGVAIMGTSISSMGSALITLFGQIPAPQTAVTANNYADTVVLTLTF